VFLISRLKAAWDSLFHQTPAERSIGQAIKRRRPRRILEIGLGNAERARRAITLARRYHPAHEMQFIGIDRFEDRVGDEQTLSLKGAYRALRSTGVRIRLIPGDAYGALVRTANELCGIDLLLISSDADRSSLSRAWFYLPRTLAKDALVLWADGQLADGQYREVARAEVLNSARPARRRAA
jgi:hypothetical protein